MFKKFLNGLVFGSGFAVAFIIISTLYFKYLFTPIINSSLVSDNAEINEIQEAPQIQQGFLGSTATYSGGFTIDRNTVLSSGSGKIKGLVTANGKPVMGLKLRLALNGKVKSQWVTTNSLGEYLLSVPYGKYKIDGYELDNQSANIVLSGLINAPVRFHFSDAFSVTKNKQGDGIHLVFVDPIIKITKQTIYQINDPILISWKPYKEATQYRLQVYEKSAPYEYRGNHTLFSSLDKPEINKTKINLKDLTKDLKSGYYYTYEVQAIDADGKIISKTEDTFQSYDFKIE